MCGATKLAESRHMPCVLARVMAGEINKTTAMQTTNRFLRVFIGLMVGQYQIRVPNARIQPILYNAFTRNPFSPPDCRKTRSLAQKTDGHGNSPLNPRNPKYRISDGTDRFFRTMNN